MVEWIRRMQYSGFVKEWTKFETCPSDERALRTVLKSFEKLSSSLFADNTPVTSRNVSDLKRKAAVQQRRQDLKQKIDSLHKQISLLHVSAPQSERELKARLTLATRRLNMPLPVSQDITQKEGAKNRAAANWTKLRNAVTPLLRSSESKVSKIPPKTLVEEYWCERFTVEIDGEERHIEAARVGPFFEEWKHGPSTFSFKEWMETIKAPTLSEEEKKALRNVRYLNEGTRAECQVSFVDQQLLLNGRTAEDGDYIFALGESTSDNRYELRMGKKVRGQFQHSSLFAGGPVIAAGMAKVRGGKIVELNNHSGHYQCDRESILLVREYLSHKDRLGAKGQVKVKSMSPGLMQLLVNIFNKYVSSWIPCFNK